MLLLFISSDKANKMAKGILELGFDFLFARLLSYVLNC